MYIASLLALLLLGTSGCAAKRINALEDQVEVQDHTIESLRAENQGYVLQVEVLRNETARLTAHNKELAALYSSIVDEFGTELAAGNASLVIFPDRTVVAVGDGITFASGSARLDKESAASIDRLAGFLKAHPDRRFQVEGHTDDAPIHNSAFASNWELGAARAVSVVNELVARGVPAERLSAASHADTSPMANNTHPEGMAENRRIAVAVQTSVKELGAQQALLEAAKKAGGARYAAATVVSADQVAALRTE
jgi:flagellar motor protein MotB